VRAERAYRNAMKRSGKQNARIEHDKAVGRAMNSFLKDDTPFSVLNEYSYNESFRKSVRETSFELRYDHPPLRNVRRTHACRTIEPPATLIRA
jgi:type I restriction enzyme, R subunit